MRSFGVESEMMINFFRSILFPSVCQNINTNLTSLQVIQRLSRVVDIFENDKIRVLSDSDKPYEGELSSHYFRVRRKNVLIDRDFEGLKIWTEGTLTENNSGCSIEVTSGSQSPYVIYLYIIMLAGLLPLMFNNLIVGGLIFLIVFTLVSLIRFLFTAQEGTKQIKFVKGIVDSDQGFDFIRYKDGRINEQLKWVGMMVFSMISAIIIVIIFVKFIAP